MKCLNMDLNEIVKICALNFSNLVKNALLRFGTAKIILLLGRFREPSALKLSLDDTYL